MLLLLGWVRDQSESGQQATTDIAGLLRPGPSILLMFSEVTKQNIYYGRKVNIITGLKFQYLIDGWFLFVPENELSLLLLILRPTTKTICNSWNYKQ